MTPLLTRSLLLAALILGNPCIAAEGNAIAKVNGVPIPQGALDQALAHATATGLPDTPELRRSLTQRLIAEELIWQEAKKAKLDATPEARLAAEIARRQSAVRQYLQRQAKVAEPGEETLKKLYATTVARLGPTEYRVRLTVTTDEGALRQAAARIAQGGDFTAETRQLSRHPAAPREGQLDWLSFPNPPASGNSGGLPLPVARAIAALKPGTTSAPIALDDAWALVRLEETRPTRIPTYAEALPALRQAARFQAAEAAGQALAANLLAKARVEPADLQ